MSSNVVDTDYRGNGNPLPTLCLQRQTDFRGNDTALPMSAKAVDTDFRGNGTALCQHRQWIGSVPLVTLMTT